MRSYLLRFVTFGAPRQIQKSDLHNLHIFAHLHKQASKQASKDLSTLGVWERETKDADFDQERQKTQSDLCRFWQGPSQRLDKIVTADYSGTDRWRVCRLVCKRSQNLEGAMTFARCTHPTKSRNGMHVDIVSHL